MSGQLRQSWLSAPSINKYVVEPNNADIFLYLNKDSMIPKIPQEIDSCIENWCDNINEKLGYKWATPKTNEEQIVEKVFNKNLRSLIFTDENYNKEVKELIENNYAKIDNHYKKLNRDKWDKTLNIHNSDQYLKLKKCAESAVEYANKNNFKYDLMVRVRPNHGWLNKLDLLRPVFPDTIYVNHSFHDVGFKNTIHIVDWVEDTLFFGSQDVMNKFCADFPEKMVDELKVCDERYDLSCATEKLLAKVLINSGIKYTSINEYFGYKGEGFFRPKLSKYFVDWTKSPNYHLVEKFCAGIDSKNNSSLAVYFDRIGDENIVLDETIIQ